VNLCSAEFRRSEIAWAGSIDAGIGKRRREYSINGISPHRAQVGRNDSVDTPEARTFDVRFKGGGSLIAASNRLRVRQAFGCRMHTWEEG